MKLLTHVNYGNIYLTTLGTTMVVGVEDRYMFEKHVPLVKLDNNRRLDDY